MTKSGASQPVECVCTQCGAKFSAAAQFCGFDGTDLIMVGAGVEPATMTAIPVIKKCPDCLQTYPSHARYCAKDGRPLHDDKDGEPTPSTSASIIGSAAGKSESAAPVVSALGEAPAPASNTRQPVPDVATEAMVFSGEPGSELALIGKTIDGKYRLESVLAEGGMAVLYLAHQIAMERTVVFKVVHGAVLNNPGAIERFERECKLAARLNHPNIVSVYDFGFINKHQPYMVMEYIKGMSLSAKLEKHGLPTLPIAAQITVQICRGLEEAHSCGVIHRDLKPENIILQDKQERPDWVKIVDFGIAHLLNSSKRLTKAGRITGTPEYMAPEQFKDKPLDVRADIYSLGVVIFEMLTGKIPFDSDDISVLMAKHLMESPIAVSDLRKDIAAGSAFDLIVRRCLEKDPAMRYPGAAELRKAIESAGIR